jgi:hypothetical protein
MTSHWPSSWPQQNGLFLGHPIGPPNGCNHYRIVGAPRKGVPHQRSLSILWPGFKSLYEGINYQYLTIFDQIES